MKKIILILVSTYIVSAVYSQVTDTGDEVGIGISTPDAKLDIYETSFLGSSLNDNVLLFRLRGRTSNVLMKNIWLLRDNTGSDWYTARIHDGVSIDGSFLTPGIDTRTWWERDPNNVIQSWGNGSTTYMTLKRGSLGIGTGSPSKKLEVVDNILVSGNRDILLDANSGSIEYHTPATGGWAMGQKFININNEYIGGWRAYGDPTSIYYYYVGTDYANPIFKIKPNGDAALQGKFEAKEIKIQVAPTADFVFNDSYELKGIDEVEMFIKENKHLPNFPSGKEIEENGINVGEMDAKLLQKIEELTLYTIEQQKQIDKQMELIQRLEGKIKQFEK